MAKLVDWPPPRFEEGRQQCEKFKLRQKLEDKQNLKRLRDRVMVITTAKPEGRVTVETFVEYLGDLLELTLEDDLDYIALQKARGPEEARIDVSCAAYVLMLRNGMVPEPVVM